MRILVFKRNTIIEGHPDSIILQQDYWDDYGYRTAFDAYYCDNTNNVTKLGWVKIGRKRQQESEVVADILPNELDRLSEEYFSLGQGRKYYEMIASLGERLGEEIRSSILEHLNDISYNLELFDAVKNEAVTKTSLLRNVSVFSIKCQFHRITQGGAALTSYKFSYTPNGYEEPLLSFEVEPDSKPPTNVHVLIGKNGVGKTTLLRNIVHSLYYRNHSFGKFAYHDTQIFHDIQPGRFANVLCVSFSPFDIFPKSGDELHSEERDLPYAYIGIDISTNNISETLTKQLESALAGCKSNRHKDDLLKKAIDNLKSDPAFESSGISDLIADNSNNDFDAGAFFDTLSSGHKMVLLTVLCCVDKIEEKSLLIMDEPENHLHPPLLSALIRTLSDLLIDRNGVCIIATHSPVILQEVPKSCVWTLRRSGERVISERPSMETFGSNVGSLTSEVFGLEVAKSGFIKLLRDSINQIEDPTYEKVLEEFDGQLGVEAQMILASLIISRKGGNGND